jgi:hypothetical protein
MELDFPTKLWQNPAIHLQMQTKLKSAVVAIAHKQPLIDPRFLLLQAQVKDPGDLYQGSRATCTRPWRNIWKRKNCTSPWRAVK